MKAGFMPFGLGKRNSIHEITKETIQDFNGSILGLIQEILDINIAFEEKI